MKVTQAHIEWLDGEEGIYRLPVMPLQIIDGCLHIGDKYPHPTVLTMLPLGGIRSIVIEVVDALDEQP